jgi:SpoVK/Ycf46/Vps4 family AAA+-type ATPase
MSDKKDLMMILQSHIPLVVIETHEEHRALELLTDVAATLGKPLKTWSITQGLNSYGYAAQTEPSSFEKWELQRESQFIEKDPNDPTAMLKQINKNAAPSIYALLDFHPHLNDPLIVRHLKEIALNSPVNQNHIVLISHSLDIPAELQRLSARFSLTLPSHDDIFKLIIEESKVWAVKNQGSKLKADKEAIKLLAKNLLGLTTTDAKHLIRNAIYDDGAITHEDVSNIAKAKYELIGQNGVLSFEYDTARFADVGGLSSLKKWLEIRKPHFVQSSDKMDQPKGILLLGIQGGGKSLAAKAVAGAWGTPLLRLDFGVLYNKFFGETEKNIREALKTAAIMAPCVLWIDEIEKGIATGDNDGGTSRRVLATLLTWMAENTAKVFIVATANSIQNLPPELIRKGRLDEIFFVDFPDPEARKEIFRIHLKKRGYTPSEFDLEALATGSHEFSGAEIEQAVVAARYAAHAQANALSTEHILRELSTTKPLSVVMSQEIVNLRQWATKKTVAAH